MALFASRITFVYRYDQFGAHQALSLLGLVAPTYVYTLCLSLQHVFVQNDTHRNDNVVPALSGHPCSTIQKTLFLI